MVECPFKMPVEYEKALGNTFAHPRTREFILAAKKEGVFAKYLEELREIEDKGLRPPGMLTKIRNFNMTITYFATPGTYKQIGKVYGRPKPLTPQRVEGIVSETVSVIWNRVSPKLQSEHPRDQIVMNKEGQLNTTLARGLRRESLTTQIATLARLGHSYPEIKNELAASSNVISAARINYSGQGVEVPFSPANELSKEVREELANPNLSADEVKKLWGKIKRGVAGHLTGEGLTISLFDATRLAGLFIRPSYTARFLPVLDKAGISYGHYQETATVKGKPIPRNYYFLRAVDLPKVIQAFEQEQGLKPFFENHVTQISGPPIKLPVTTALINKRGFDSLNNLTRRHGVNFARRLPISIEKFFVDANCPSPIITYTRHSKERFVYYPLDYEEHLDAFIPERKRQLGLS